MRPDGRPAPMPAVARMRGGWSTRHVLLLFGLCFVAGGDCMPLSAQQASLTYSRASIYDGLPAALVGNFILFHFILLFIFFCYFIS